MYREMAFPWCSYRCCKLNPYLHHPSCSGLLLVVLVATRCLSACIFASLVFVLLHFSFLAFFSFLFFIFFIFLPSLLLLRLPLVIASSVCTGTSTDTANLDQISLTPLLPCCTFLAFQRLWLLDSNGMLSYFKDSERRAKVIPHSATTFELAPTVTGNGSPKGEHRHTESQREIHIETKTNLENGV